MPETNPVTRNGPPSLVCAIGSETSNFQDEEIRKHLYSFLDAIGPKEDVLLLPPDFTRLHSHAGEITQMITQYYGLIKSEKEKTAKKQKIEETKDMAVPSIEILPTLGTHQPMTQEQIKIMFGEELASLKPSPFLVHDWRNDVTTIGHAPSEMVSKATHGMVNKPWPAQLNKLVWEKRHNRDKSVVISIGQVVPHEVMGMANFNKNMFVGAGGLEAINLSHFIGAVYGMENMMGRADNPLRSILNYASEKFLGDLDLWYVLTVIGTNSITNDLEVKGFYIGNNIDCYTKACDLSLKINFTMVEKAPSKMVVYLNDDEFHSTWLGNKAIYRTRMAIADQGELIILAPGVKRFGEDDAVDELIRKYGYVGTPNVMKAMEENDDLKDSLGTVAHLIHGSTEGRFNVTYCPGHLTQEEIESVGYKYAKLDEVSKVYDVNKLMDGWQKDAETGEEFFFIRNPALGLWAIKSKFDKEE